MPLVLWTTLLLLLNLAKSTGPEGNSDGVESGILNQMGLLCRMYY